MRREIKFRAWVETRAFNGEPKGFEYLDLYVDNENDFANFPPENIEQYTGLKDKNGKEIYEGDIVTETIDDGDNKIIQIYEVYWDEDMLNFGIRGTKGFNYNLHDELWETNASREVIGNIHENPELLPSS